MKTLEFKSLTVFDVPDDIRSFVLCGDIHGEFETIVNKMCRQHGMTDTVLFVLGDSGFGFHRYNYYVDLFKNIDVKLKEANNYILFGRGNHDNPEYFVRDIGFRSERCFCVPDYSVIRYNGKSILWVGGAVSVDRSDRIAADSANADIRRHAYDPFYPRSYWGRQERPVFREDYLDDISAMFVIDTVATHTCPSFVGKTDRESISGWLSKDSSLENDLISERAVMDDILKYLTCGPAAAGHAVSKWFYGHFHDSKSEIIDDIEYNMLNVNEFKELYNLL